MGFLVDVPVEGGGRLLVEAVDAHTSDELTLAAPHPTEMVKRATQSLEHSLDEIQPAMRALVERLTTMAPDEVTLEFGLQLGTEVGAVVAKGSSDVHFTVSLTWHRDTASVG